MIPQNTFLIEQTVNIHMIPQNTFLIEQNSEYQHDSTEYFLNRTKQ